MIELGSKQYGFKQMQLHLKKGIPFEKIKQVLIQGGFRIEGTAKVLCRQMGAVDTGRLINSISTSWSTKGGRGDVQAPAKPQDGVSQPSGSMYSFVVRVGTNVEYAVYVHYGTRSMQARPFLDMAAKIEQPNIQQDLDNLMEDWLDGKETS